MRATLQAECGRLPLGRNADAIPRRGEENVMDQAEFVASDPLALTAPTPRRRVAGSCVLVRT